MTENQTPERQEQERQAAREAGQKAFNDLMHTRLNQVQVSRITTRDELNAALRRAAGRGTNDQTGDDAA